MSKTESDEGDETRNDEVAPQSASETSGLHAKKHDANASKKFARHVAISSPRLSNQTAQTMAADHGGVALGQPRVDASGPEKLESRGARTYLAVPNKGRSRRRSQNLSGVWRWRCRPSLVVVAQLRRVVPNAIGYLLHPSSVRKGKVRPQQSLCKRPCVREIGGSMYTYLRFFRRAREEIIPTLSAGNSVTAQQHPLLCKKNAASLLQKNRNYWSETIVVSASRRAQDRRTLRLAGH